MIQRLFYVLLVAMVAFPMPSPAATRDEPSADRFVSTFYEQYLRDSPSAPGDSALVAVVEPDDLLGEPLRNALRADLEAQRAAVGEIVGLDFDPFLDTQDPTGYTLGLVSCLANRCEVMVRRDSDGGDTTATVVVVVAQVGHGWRIMDVVYPTHSSLLQVLESLREQRAAPGPSSQARWTDMAARLRSG